MNIYDKAHELANQIKTNEDVVRYKELRDELYRDEGSKKLITDYKKMQFEAQAVYLSGNEVPQEMMDRLQKCGEVLQFNPKITEFFALEYKVNTLISDLYKIIGEACGLDTAFLESNS